MKKQYSFLALCTAILISTAAMAGYGDYNLGSTKLKSPHLTPNKSIQAIQATAGNKGITEGGFFLHYNPYYASARYGFASVGTITVNEGYSDEYELTETETEVYLGLSRSVGRYKWGHGLEIGNIFRLVDFEPMAISLRVTWLDFGYSGFKANSAFSDYDIIGGAFDLRLLKIGPSFTYALSDQMAIDVFYQLSPTFIAAGYAGEYTDLSTGDTEFVGYGLIQYGLGHEIGLTYRFDILSIGLGYGMGNMKAIVPTIYEGDNTYSFEGKANINTFRLMVGMKF
ncbi:MAG: hypothetical protein JKY53_09155 [Flavobacteriales bacterium]|nr:hypothetical protein [Flavobacteriales bacterium]